MSFPSYPAYKPSGVRWLGEVPADWELRRIGYYFSERREKVSDKDFPPLSVTKGGIVPQLETAAKTDDGDNRKLVRTGDFVINSRSDRKGSSGISPSDGSVSLINTVLIPSDEMYGKFAHHVFRSVQFQEEYYRFGKGIVADLWSTSYAEMRNITLAVPKYEEQIAIAEFVDHETAKIDALLAEQEKLIELLAEKRQATIDHAVSGGTNPIARTQKSGVSWIGEIPMHWVAVPLKRLCKLLKDGTHLPPPRVDEGIPLLSVRNIDQCSFGFREDDSMISEPDYAELCRAFIPMAGDVLLAIVGATLGKVAVVPQGMGRFHIQRSLAIFRPNADVLPDWLFYCISSGAFQRMLWENVGFSAQPGIYLGALKDICVPIPPLDEQRATIAFMRDEVARLNVLKTEAERAIDLLKGRRAALITAAVTGQIDVRSVEGVAA